MCFNLFYFKIWTKNISDFGHSNCVCSLHTAIQLHISIGGHEQSHSGGFIGHFGQWHIDFAGAGSVGFRGHEQSHFGGGHFGQKQIIPFLPDLFASGLIGHEQSHVGASAGHIGHSQLLAVVCSNPVVFGGQEQSHSPCPIDEGRMIATQIITAKTTKNFILVIFCNIFCYMNSIQTKTLDN